MRVVMTLLVRNEDDVLDAHLGYHLSQGVDFVVATDNRSTDGTRAILERYAAQGVLHVIEERRDDYAQSRWVTRMARLAATKFDADWVLHADADEFFFAGDQSVRDAIGAIGDDYGIVTIPRLEFRPRPDCAAPWHQRLVVRDALARNALGQPLQPKVAHRGHRSAVVAMGNHDVGRVPFARTASESIAIFHYPLRSYEQFEAKVRVAAPAVARNRRLSPEICAHWRWFEQLLEHGKLRDYYDSQAIDDAAVEAGVAAGELVVDTRLAQVMAASRS